MLYLTKPLRTLVGSSHSSDVAVCSKDPMIAQHFSVQRRLVSSCDIATVVSGPDSDQIANRLHLDSALPNGTAYCGEFRRRSLPIHSVDSVPPDGATVPARMDAADGSVSSHDNAQGQDGDSDTDDSDTDSDTDESDENSNTDNSDKDTGTDVDFLNQTQKTVQARLCLNKQLFDARYHALYPKGWIKLGLSVLGYYRNDLWLDDTKGWTVAYHGTTASNVASIVREGLRVRGGMSDHVYVSKLNEGKVCEWYGTGIYVSYLLKTAESYSREFKMNHSHYKVVLQCRVRPGYFETTTSSRGILLINDERDVRMWYFDS